MYARHSITERWKVATEATTSCQVRGKHWRWLYVEQTFCITRCDWSLRWPSPTAFLYCANWVFMRLCRPFSTIIWALLRNPMVNEESGICWKSAWVRVYQRPGYWLSHL